MGEGNLSNFFSNLVKIEEPYDDKYCKLTLVLLSALLPFFSIDVLSTQSIGIDFLKVDFSNDSNYSAQLC